MAKRTFRLFLDSNVILSGLLSDIGAPRVVLDLLSLQLPFLKGLTGRYNLIEIERNLRKKMPALFPVYKRYLPRLNLKIIPLPRLEEIREFSGHVTDKDVPVIVSALQGKADFLVTGDKRLFEKLKVRGDYPFKTVTPAEFLDLVFPDILKGIEGGS